MSAVILGAIVVMWAVILVPMWIRRHDAATESRSVERFSTAMRVLSRRSAGGRPDRRYVVMPGRRGPSQAVHVSGASAPHSPPAKASRTARSRPSLAARRRRTLLGMLLVAFVTFVLAIAGVMPWWLQIVVDVVCAAFVVHLRNQVRRSAAINRTRRPAQRRPAESARPVRPAAAAAAYQSVEMPTEMDEATGTDGVDVTWEPVPVPRPTYTMKPAAYVDAETPAAAHTEPVPPPAIDDEPSDLDVILDHRWAVND